MMSKNGLGSTLGIVGVVMAIVALMVSVWRVGPQGPRGVAGEPGRDGKIIAPVGAIVAWHETPTGVNIDKSLVGGGKDWMRCSGQIVQDPESPFVGHYLPDLNGALSTPPDDWPGNWPYGKRLFLRGGKTSGDFQEATAVPVIAEYSEGAVFIGNKVANPAYSDIDGEVTSPGRKSITTHEDPGDANPRLHAIRVRPVNMSVVWIMRVK